MKNNKTYKGLMNDNDVMVLNEMIEGLYEGDGMCGIDEICGVICGKEYYGNWDDKDLEYVKEVMREFRGILVGFDLENEVMFMEGEVEDE